MYAIAKMGKGKTLWATNYALDYIIMYPKNNIIANYRLKLPNFIYSPFMFMCLSKLHDCLIIGDDFKSLEALQRFISIIANQSRKKRIEVILTAQYYTMIPPTIREISDFSVETEYIDYKDRLNFNLVDLDGNIEEYCYKNAVNRVKNLYDTREVVKVPNEKLIIFSIMKYSEYLEDVEANLFSYSGNRKLRQSLMKSILKIRNYEYSETYLNELKDILGEDLVKEMCVYES